MCRVDDCERVEILQNADRKARKRHKCSECYRPILAGETYHYECGICEGSFDTYRTCSHCMVARGWLAENCGGWVYTQVLEEIEEHAEEYPKIAFGLNRIIVGAKRKWQSFGGGLMAIPKMPPELQQAM